MKVVIDITDEMWQAVQDGWVGNDLWHSALENGTPYETVTEFADRCRECGREKVLDKIRDEIEQTVSRYSISQERGCMGQIEWSDRLIKESEVLQIIDKYKAESEEGAVG